jgi:hypothetical protein
VQDGEKRPGVADEAMSEADGAGGGQKARCKARVKVGAGGTAVAGETKPVAKALAWCRM